MRRLLGVLLVGALFSAVGCSSWIAALKGEDADATAQNESKGSLGGGAEFGVRPGSEPGKTAFGHSQGGRSPASIEPMHAQTSARPRMTHEDFIDKSQEEGSLWASSGQTNYYFTKNRIRSPGDIISMTLEDELYKQIVAEIKQTFSLLEQSQEVATLREGIREKLLNSPLPNRDTLLTSSAAPQKTPERAPASEASPTPAPTPSVAAGTAATSTPQNTQTPPVGMTPDEATKIAEKYGFADVDIAPLLELKNGDKFMGEIAQRFPNGNYQIRAAKRVNYKHGESRYVTVLGVVKAAEINEETDVVASGKLYETQIDISR